MATAPRRLVLAFIAFTGLCATAPREAAAEGLKRGPLANQPLEVWSKAGSGLLALESRCEVAARAGWRFQETIDPWAEPVTPCALAQPTSYVHPPFEIVYPWPAERSDAWAASREIVDPWAERR